MAVSWENKTSKLRDYSYFIQGLEAVIQRIKPGIYFTNFNISL